MLPGGCRTLAAGLVVLSVRLGAGGIAGTATRSYPPLAPPPLAPPPLLPPPLLLRRFDSAPSCRSGRRQPRGMALQAPGVIYLWLRSSVMAAAKAERRSGEATAAPPPPLQRSSERRAADTCRPTYARQGCSNQLAGPQRCRALLQTAHGHASARPGGAGAQLSALPPQPSSKSAATLPSSPRDAHRCAGRACTLLPHPRPPAQSMARPLQPAAAAWGAHNREQQLRTARQLPPAPHAPSSER